MSIYLIGDSHFFHTNIIKYESRPFENAEEMNKEIIKRWNKTVKGSDTVIHLGDVALGPGKKVVEILSKLNGNKWLVMGNHDFHRTVGWWQRAGFERVYDLPVIYEKFFILSHEPVYLNESMPYVNCHGHTHSKKMEYKGYVNMSVENWDYKPVAFEDIKKSLAP